MTEIIRGAAIWGGLIAVIVAGWWIACAPGRAYERALERWEDEGPHGQ